MRLATLALVSLLAMPSFATADGPAPAAGAWWDTAWHFRLTIALATNATDPATGEQVTASGAPTILVPVDITSSLARDARWPTDASGAPLGWTFDPSTLRVLDHGALLPSAFLPFDPRAPDAAYDAHAAARGTLVVQGAAPGDTLLAYFDSKENGAKPAATTPPPDAFGIGPGVHARARVPEPPSDASQRLVVVPLGAPVAARASRLATGTAPEELANGTARGTTRFALPPGPYDLDVRTDAPALFAIETDRASGATYPALAGGAVGTTFLAPALGGADATLDLVGAGDARASVRVTDAATGAAVTTTSLARLAASPPLIVPAGATYRVDATAPIVVLSRGGDALAAMTLVAPGALVAERAGVHALVAPTAGNAQAYPLARPQDALSGRVGDPPRDAWATRAASSATAEPWAFLAPDGAAGVTGSAGATSIPAALGEDALAPIPPAPDAASARPLDAALEAPFASTHVRVETRGLDGALVSDSSTQLSAPAALTTTPDGSAALARDASILHVRTSRPAAVFVSRPGTPASFFLPALPPLVAPASARLDAQGPLLSWDESALEASGRPGERVRARLPLTNLGRGADGAPLAEDVRFALARVDDERCNVTWDAALAVASIPGVPSPGSASADVLVALSSNATDGACETLRVTATGSHGGVPVEALVTVRARSTFQPELRIVDETGTRSSERTLDLAPGVERVVRLELRNIGAEAGTARVAMTPAPGYQVALEGASGDVALRPDEQANLTLRVTAPTGAEPAWDLVLEATSASDPTQRDQATVSLRPRANVTLDVAVAPPILHPTPGESTNASVRVRNDGGELEVALRLADALPPGWTASFDPSRAVLGPGATLNATLTLRAPANASVGSSVPLVIAARPTLSDAPGARAGVVAIVANDFTLDVAAPPTLAVAGPPAHAAEPIGLASRAAGRMELRLRAVAAPRGWLATLVDLPAALAPGERATTTLRYAVQAGTPPGDGEVAVAFELRDATSPARLFTWSIPVSTGTRASLRVAGLPASTVLSPGRAGTFTLRVTNDGNAPSSLAPDVHGPATLDWPASALAPGATAVATLHVLANDSATLVVGDARMLVIVAGASLVVTSAREAAQDSLVVDVANRGEGRADAPHVRVLDAAGRTVGEATLAPLASGASTTRTLLVPEGTGALRVTVDGGNTVDLPRAASVAQPRTVAAPGWALAALALVAGLAWRRRSP